MENLEMDILLVEDNENDAELTLRALKPCMEAGKIVHAKDGEEALKYIFGSERQREENYRVNPRFILLDIKLPKVDGFEVLDRIRKNEKTKCIPVVMLTSSNEEQDVLRSYKLGVNSYIMKPVEYNDFIKAVKEVGAYWLSLNEQPNSE